MAKRQEEIQRHVTVKLEEVIRKLVLKVENLNINFQELDVSFECRFLDILENVEPKPIAKLDRELRAIKLRTIPFAILKIQLKIAVAALKGGAAEVLRTILDTKRNTVDSRGRELPNREQPFFYIKYSKHMLLIIRSSLILLLYLFYNSGSRNVFLSLFIKWKKVVKP